MIELVASRKPKIAAICREHGVQVDMTTTDQVTSDWFREHVDASKELLFEAERASVAG